MQAIHMDKNIWTEVFTGITKVNFKLEFPMGGMLYKIYVGDSMPPIYTTKSEFWDNEIVNYSSYTGAKQQLVVIDNETPVNVYIFPLDANGKIVYV